jgi:hypothetical protein
MKFSIFEQKVNPLEKVAWESFPKSKAENYRDLVHELLNSHKALAYNMSLKIYYVCTASDDHSERFHQEISNIEGQYQGNWNSICWLTTVVLSRAYLHVYNETMCKNTLKIDSQNLSMNEIAKKHFNYTELQKRTSKNAVLAPALTKLLAPFFALHSITF